MQISILRHRALISAILTPFVCHIINCRLGIAPPSQKAKLRLRSAGVLVIAVSVTILVHLLVADLLYDNMYIYSPGTKFGTFESFKEHMETPLSPDGEPLTLYSEGDEYKIYSDSDGGHYVANRTEYISGKPETSFYNANKSIWKVSQSKDAIYTYNRQQYIQAQDRFIVMMLLISIIYPAEIAVTILIYRRKNKVTQK